MTEAAIIVLIFARHDESFVDLCKTEQGIRDWFLVGVIGQSHKIWNQLQDVRDIWQVFKRSVDFYQWEIQNYFYIVVMTT